MFLRKKFTFVNFTRRLTQTVYFKVQLSSDATLPIWGNVQFKLTRLISDGIPLKYIYKILFPWSTFGLLVC